LAPFAFLRGIRVSKAARTYLQFGWQASPPPLIVGRLVRRAAAEFLPIILIAGFGMAEIWLLSRPFAAAAT
jgi:hypothetical protein